MNAITQTKTTPTEQLRAQISAMGPELRNALPGHIKPEKFSRVVMTVVQQSPDLLSADRKSLLGACMKCAADGLVPDGREAALVIFNVKNKDGSWEKRVQYMPMLAGIIKRVRNSGEIASVQAHVIYANDHFVIRRGLNETIEHTPLFPGDRGKPIGAYAVAKFKDGSDPQFEIMDIDAIQKVRAVSRAKDSGPWVQWWDEMARKTVFRRLSKWLPMDAEAEDLMRRDDEIGTINAVAEPAGAIPAIEQSTASKLDLLEGDVGDETSGASDDGSDAAEPDTATDKSA